MKIKTFRTQIINKEIHICLITKLITVKKIKSYRTQINNKEVKHGCFNYKINHA